MGREVRSSSFELEADQCLVTEPDDDKVKGPTSWPGILALLAVFLLSGVAQPLLSTEAKNAGMGNLLCQFQMAPFYAGGACAGLVAWNQRWRGRQLHRSAMIAILDLTAQVLNYSGNELAGSAVFAVIYASVTIWTAVLSYLILGRVLTRWQWLAVVTVFGGLAVSTAGAALNLDKQVLTGAICIMVGAGLHAGMYVLSEMVSAKSDVKIPPIMNCSVQGATNALLLCVWQLAYTSWHWAKISEPVEEAGGWGRAVPVLFYVALANFLHSGTFFFLLAWIGSVTTGVLKGLQAVMVFIAADILFCDSTPDGAKNCFTTGKTISLMAVVVGVVGYGMATSRIKKA